LHLIDVYTDDADKAYQAIRHELSRYSNDLAIRPEIVALTKIEGVDKEIIDMQMAAILKENPEAEVYAVSAPAKTGLNEVLRALRQAVDEARLADEEVIDEGEGLPVISLSEEQQQKSWDVD
ncbi:MAG TPA: GTPase ObgE, partial [Candidatus Saccharibacteria bacterium]|nr:GTPase ObgE [Candidatus Saccharibacteria bacterium]